jgi:hypothetical protein
MGKLDIGVGDEFPVNEPEAASSQSPGSDRATSHEDWHRRRDEWRAHRRVRKAEWRARKHAFKVDLRRSAKENFGPFARRHHPFIRVLIAAGLVALAVAVLPLLFLLGGFVAAIMLFAAHRGHRHHDEYPVAGGRSEPVQ